MGPRSCSQTVGQQNHIKSTTKNTIIITTTIVTTIAKRSREKEEENIDASADIEVALIVAIFNDNGNSSNRVCVGVNIFLGVNFKNNTGILLVLGVMMGMPLDNFIVSGDVDCDDIDNNYSVCIGTHRLIVTLRNDAANGNR